jgi:hypothetical protein
MFTEDQLLPIPRCNTCCFVSGSARSFILSKSTGSGGQSIWVQSRVTMSTGHSLPDGWHIASPHDFRVRFANLRTHIQVRS